MGSAVQYSNFDYMIKILLVGNHGVGKSSLLCRYCDDKFPLEGNSTKGISFKTKVIMRNDNRVKLQIWDISGEERFRSLASAYFRGAQGFVLVYDIADEASFLAAKNWLKLLREQVRNSPVGILVGNKADLQDRRAVKFTDGAKLARTHELTFIEASAADSKNIADVFEPLAAYICDKLNVQAEAESSIARVKRSTISDSIGVGVIKEDKESASFEVPSSSKSHCFIL